MKYIFVLSTCLDFAEGSPTKSLPSQIIGERNDPHRLANAETKIVKFWQGSSQLPSKQPLYIFEVADVDTFFDKFDQT